MQLLLQYVVLYYVVLLFLAQVGRLSVIILHKEIAFGPELTHWCKTGLRILICYCFWLLNKMLDLFETLCCSNAAVNPWLFCYNHLVVCSGSRSPAVINIGVRKLPAVAYGSCKVTSYYSTVIMVTTITIIADWAVFTLINNTYTKCR